MAIIILRDEIVKQGWLARISVERPSESCMYWCVLTPMYFCSFKDRERRKPTEVICLGECSNVRSGSLVKVETSIQHAFYIDAPNQTFYFAAKTFSEKEGWMRCIGSEMMHPVLFTVDDFIRCEALSYHPEQTYSQRSMHSAGPVNMAAPARASCNEHHTVDVEFVTLGGNVVARLQHLEASQVRVEEMKIAISEATRLSWKPATTKLLHYGDLLHNGVLLQDIPQERAGLVSLTIISSEQARPRRRGSTLARKLTGGDSDSD